MNQNKMFKLTHTADSHQTLWNHGHWPSGRDLVHKWKHLKKKENVKQISNILNFKRDMLKAIKLENTVFFLHHQAGFRKHYIHWCRGCTFRLHGPCEGAQEPSSLERLKSRSFSNSKCSGEQGQKVSVPLGGAFSLKFTGSLEGWNPCLFFN